MFPGDVDGGVLVGRLLQLLLQLLDLSEAELCVDRQAATNGCRLNRRQGTNIIELVAIHFLGGIGREHIPRCGILGQQNLGQGQSAIKPAATELPKPARRLSPCRMQTSVSHNRLGGFRRRNRMVASLNESGSRQTKTKKDQHFFHNAFSSCMKCDNGQVALRGPA